MPFNVGPTMNAREWRMCVDWLPEAFRSVVSSATVMQNDINEFARAGARAFIDAGAFGHSRRSGGGRFASSDRRMAESVGKRRRIDAS